MLHASAVRADDVLFLTFEGLDGWTPHRFRRTGSTVRPAATACSSVFVPL
ncbi:hypothetical protein STXM2123_5139 [Streptomyces sp. F-3]|nr:hypothetical protein STXM2123_5139 [Streptomyces sp. F-3]